jgi:hypothetical protein
MKPSESHLNEIDESQGITIDGVKDIKGLQSQLEPIVDLTEMTWSFDQFTGLTLHIFSKLGSCPFFQ